MTYILYHTAFTPGNYDAMVAVRYGTQLHPENALRPAQMV